VTTLTDDFNTADAAAVGHLLAFTDRSGNIENNSNHAMQPSSTAGTLGVSIANSDLASSDHYTEAVLQIGTPTTGSTFCGVTVRGNASNGDCYYAFIVRGSAGTPQLQIGKYIGGVRTALGANNITLGSWTNGTDVLRLKCDGPTLTAYQNGTKIGAAYDKDITIGTRPGLMMSAGTSATRSTTWADSLSASDITPALIRPRQIVRLPTATAATFTIDSSTGWVAPLPGSRIVLVFGSQASPGARTYPTGFGVDETAQDDVTFTEMASKISDGTETSLTVTTGATAGSGIVAIELTGAANVAHGPTATAAGGGTVNTLTVGPTAAASFSGIAIAANCPSGSWTTWNSWASDILSDDQRYNSGTLIDRPRVGYEVIDAGATPGSTGNWQTVRRAAEVMVVYYDTSANTAGQTVNLGLATGSASALPARTTKIVHLGIATGMSSALAVTSSKMRGLGLAAEAAAALGATLSKSRHLGLPTEVDGALQVTLSKSRQLGLATQTDAALSASALKTRPVGLATELDGGLALHRRKTRQMGLAASSEAGLHLVVSRSLRLGFAGEVSTALVARPSKLLQLLQALEVDEALAVFFAVATPPERVCRVPAELRLVMIAGELRTVIVPAESRVLEVSR
jgi:hypothetical protein